MNTLFAACKLLNVKGAGKVCGKVTNKFLPIVAHTTMRLVHRSIKICAMFEGMLGHLAISWILKA